MIRVNPCPSVVGFRLLPAVIPSLSRDLGLVPVVRRASACRIKPQPEGWTTNETRKRFAGPDGEGSRIFSIEVKRLMAKRNLNHRFRRLNFANIASDCDGASSINRKKTEICPSRY